MATDQEILKALDRELFVGDGSKEAFQAHGDVVRERADELFVELARDKPSYAALADVEFIGAALIARAVIASAKIVKDRGGSIEAALESINAHVIGSQAIVGGLIYKALTDEAAKEAGIDNVLDFPKVG